MYCATIFTTNTNKQYEVIMSTSTTPIFTERKVLNTSACQGLFTIDQQEDTAEAKQVIVTKLVRDKYLKHISIDRGIATYKITDSGKERLKVLNNSIPKHNPVEDKCIGNSSDKGTVSDKGNISDKPSLESVLSKRLHILKSANSRGLEFNLTDANVRKLLNTKVCYYTGVAFNKNNDPLNIRTFERVDDTKGYVQGNVVVVTLRANRIKNLLVEQDNELNIGIEQFINMAEQIKKHQ